MSRHVATIGRQQLPTILAISPCAVRGITPLSCGINTGKALSSPYSSSHRAIWNNAIAIRHDPNKDSVMRWSSVATSISRTPRPTTTFFARIGAQSQASFQFESIAGFAQKRWKSNKASPAEARPAHEGQKIEQPSKVPDALKHTPGGSGKHHILDHLPHLHRPTKEELLAAATGFWQRLGVRFKWFSIRSARPFRVDEIFAFLSWIFWGHVLWIVIGTTTFFSLLIFALNTVFAQETLAGWIGEYLTKSSGVKVVFESAIVPTWKDGVITFRRVFVSRRPGNTRTRERAVSKGSAESAAAAAAANPRVKDDYDPDEDTNYTQFDVTFDTVNVTLSFTKWFNGKGLLQDVEVRGVRGVVDRTFVHWTDEVIDPKSYRHKHNIGDFEIDSFKMSDVLLTLYQPNNFRPFTISIFSCELPRLRKQWLFYDFLSAETISGSFDNSLFTIHPVQAHGHTGVALDGGASMGDPRQWKKQSRLRLDGLKIDHLNRGVNGPLSWIQEGNVDIVADITIPRDDDEGIVKVVSDFYDRIEATVANVQTPFHKDGGTDYNTIDNNDHEPSTDAYRTQVSMPFSNSDDPADSRFIIFDLRVHLNDVRASVPLFTKDLSYVNNALVRPIVAYINTKRAFIPVHCRVVKQQSEFDGSWTIFDSGLLDDLSRETYEAFSRDITDADRTSRRIRKVGLWTLQVAAQALFIGLVGQVA